MKRAFIIRTELRIGRVYPFRLPEFDADNLYRRMTAAGIKNITVAKGKYRQNDLFDILAGWNFKASHRYDLHNLFGSRYTCSPEADG